jgi:hypothetical protein
VGDPFIHFDHVIDAAPAGHGGRVLPFRGLANDAMSSSDSMSVNDEVSTPSWGVRGSELGPDRARGGVGVGGQRSTVATTGPDCYPRPTMKKHGRIHEHRSARGLRFFVGLCATIFFAAAWAGTVSAGPLPATDHLACYKAKHSKLVGLDGKPLVHEGASLSLLGLPEFAARSDCSLKVNATSICRPAAFSPGVTSGGGGVPISGLTQTGDLICYKIKCKTPAAKDALPADFELEDGFALRTFTGKKAKLHTVCTPTLAATPPPACSFGGVEVGPACWWLSAFSESCDDLCGGFGLVYDGATSSYAGRNGTTANCQSVLDALDAPGDVVIAVNGNNGFGCYYTTFLTPGRQRDQVSATSSSASSSAFRHACACQ